MNESIEHLGSMKVEMSGMRAEMLIIRQHLAGWVGAQTLHDTEIASIKIRLGRIEKRLELAD